MYKRYTSVSHHETSFVTMLFAVLALCAVAEMSYSYRTVVHAHTAKPAGHKAVVILEARAR